MRNLTDVTSTANCGTCGLEFNQRISTSTYCSNKCAIIGRSTPAFEDSLLAKFPDFAAEADGWDASKVAPGSNKKLRWKCEHGHQWEALVINRTKKGTHCPYCSGRNAIAGVNDLATTHPELAIQADGWDPSTIGAGSGSKLGWKCERGHQWEAAVETRSKRGSGCPFCYGRVLIPGETDLATTHPDIAAQADGWDPTKVMAGTNKKLPWVCSLGHRWTTMPIHRLNGSNCPVCMNRKILIGFNDLATTHPEIAAQADGWDPKTIFFGSGPLKNWRCNLGHTWRTSCNSRTSQGLGCPYCGNQKVWPGFNDLASTHPHLLSDVDGWDPTIVSAGSPKRVKWICSEGHRWKGALSDRKAGTGCPTCAKFGFDPNKDGYLYFLEHEVWGMFQIGITNVPEKRLQKHRRGGWRALEVRGPMDGHLTRELETGILRALRNRGAKLGKAAGMGEFDGWSEAWLSSSFQTSGLPHLIELVYEDD
jgi:hypothetical protein